MATKREHVDTLKDLRDEMNAAAGRVIYAYRNGYRVEDKDLVSLQAMTTAFINHTNGAIRERA